MKKLETVGAVHTHTHVHCNLIDSLKMIYKGIMLST